MGDAGAKTVVCGACAGTGHKAVWENDASDGKRRISHWTDCETCIGAKVIEVVTVVRAVPDSTAEVIVGKPGDAGADAFGAWLETEAGQAVFALFGRACARLAWAAATERAAAIVMGHGPMDTYTTDADGNESPEKASWDSQKEHVADRILGGAV